MTHEAAAYRDAWAHHRASGAEPLLIGSMDNET
jgi:hypothetical protein